MFVAVSVLAGILVAGLGVPFAALAAGSTRAGASALHALPADLSVPAQHEASTMYLADGSQLAKFYDQNRQYVSLDQISPEMQMAQIAIEDHRFFEHGAIDVQSVVRAGLGNAAGGGISGGGSTLTQQYVKLVRVQMCNGEKTCEAAAQAPTMERKILEMRYAIALEQNLSKEEILERYLNLAYYGDGAYGVQAAARHYYNTDASQLDVAQAAMLAGLVQNPGNSDPVNNLAAALNRRRAVLDAQVRYQGMPQEMADAAGEAGFDGSQVQSTPNGCKGTRYPFICDYAQRVLLGDQMSSLGDSYQDRLNVLNRSGLRITLTVDPHFQEIAQNAVSSIVGPEDAVIAVADTVDPKTGRIVSMAQSRPQMGDGPGQTAWNYSVGYNMGGAEGFMFGSTFKIWTAAAAVQQGHYPDTTYYNVKPSQNWRGQTFRGCGDDKFVFNDNYITTNAVRDQTSGNFNMVTGMMWSVNNYWISLEKDVGPCQAAEMAERAGVELSWPVADDYGFGDELRDWGQIPSFTLGAPLVTPLSMAVGYGTFGNRGVHCKPIILDSITTREGVQVPVPGSDCQQTIDPQVADAVNYVMNRTHTSGLSASTYIPNGIDQASKTGTSDNSLSSSAFVGYTRDLSTAVIVAGDNTIEAWKNTPEQWRNVQTMPLSPLGGRSLGSYGRGDAGVIWRPLMEQAMQGMEVSRFERWVSPVPITPPPRATPTDEETPDRSDSRRDR